MKGRLRLNSFLLMFHEDIQKIMHLLHHLQPVTSQLAESQLAESQLAECLYVGVRNRVRARDRG